MIHLFYGENPTPLETTACDDLCIDLQQVTGETIKISSIPAKLPLEGLIIIVGSPSTNNFIAKLISEDKLPISTSNPGKRGGCVHVLDYEGHSILILAGSDDQGAQYMVYDFSRKELGVDPFNYWTDYSPKRISNFSFAKVENRIIHPPKVPILCYFDNDNDELANMTQPYLEFSFENWQEVIKSLVRLKYNAIDIHDHLGRAEFYRWDFYKELRPDYKVNSELVEQLIDYAHDRGIMIQVSFYLGWNFKTITDKASLHYFQHKQEWIDVWTYYLKHTPIGKCDIFLNRPRDQKWDRRYRGKGANSPEKVFNDAFPAMYDVLKAHNPKAIVIADLYSEGMQVYRDGFRPEPKDGFIMAWPDNGFGKFKNMPENLHGYKFGIYMHAGFFLNHVVQDPYPILLANEMKKGILDYGMDQYCLVNGQTFRHYLMNLELCSIVCEDPVSIDPEQFYLDWVARYFGQDVKVEIVQILKYLHEAQQEGLGYIKVMGFMEISKIRLKLLKYLRIFPRSWILKLFAKYGGLGEDYTQKFSRNLEYLDKAQQLADLITTRVRDENFLYHDHILLPIKLLLQVNQMAYELQLAAYDYKNKTHLNRVIEMVEEHTQIRMEGDKNPKWATWYDPAKRRPNGGYPSIKELKQLL